MKAHEHVNLPCEECGLVRACCDLATVYVPQHDAPFVMFVCPTCDQVGQWRFGNIYSEVIDTLIDLGVAVYHQQDNNWVGASTNPRTLRKLNYRPPAPRLTAPGPPFTLDDLIDFHQLLSSTDDVLSLFTEPTQEE